MPGYHLETDLEKIRELGHLREDENYRFRTFLKNRNAHKIDLLVHRLNEEIAPRIDCTACGNCCRQLSPCLTKEDLKHLTEATRLSVEEVIATYTETDDDGPSFKHLPCSFLKDNKCSIYQHRPETCASFPHLHKSNFNSRSRQAIENYSICPIIFNVLERLKVEMRFE
jgi:Fe-S-cluster containining protein